MHSVGESKMDTITNTVLLVDDDPMNLSALMHILGQEYTVYAEEDGLNCIESAKRLMPDLILLDVVMPNVSGFEIIKSLKEDVATKNIPVIFLTVRNTTEDEVKGFALGAVDYINKPFSVPVVKMRIQHQMQIINQKRKIQSLKETEEIEHQRKEQKRINKRIQLIIDSAPISIELYDTDGTMMDCNAGTIVMHGFDDRDEYIKFYNETPESFYPEFQPCGTPSEAMMSAFFQEALHKGIMKFEWTHRTIKGEDFPTKVTLACIKHDDTTMIVAYVHDLRAIKKLENARIEAIEGANQAKSRFLAHMSHEIRTPITAVLGISEVQLRNKTMPPHTEEAFAQIYNSSKTLLGIVNDILDISKIEAGKITLMNSEYDVPSLINDAAQLYLAYIERKDVLFNMFVDENLPAKLIGDVLRIRQIINNLLTNAFKYTESGTVSLSLKCEKTIDEYVALIISIKDTGIGMTASQVDAMKYEYVRLNEHNAPNITGTGLGIPIVCGLIQMMDAQLDIDSDVGKGTHVVVRIDQLISGTQILGREVADNLQKFEVGALSVAKDLEFELEQMPYGKVLVVDDVDTNLYVAEAMLESFGLSVDLCKSGQEAIEKVKQGDVYDIIFLDHMMPSMDGIEAMKILRDMGYDKPIIALTANVLKGQAEFLMNNGFSGFMSKPIDIKLLNSYLLRFIRDKQIEQT